MTSPSAGQAVAQVMDRAADQPTDSSADLNPYVGPRPFRPKDSHLYFGREREARDVASLVVANRTLLIYSQSGAGKTSLINARVAPLLVKKGCEVLPPTRVQGRLPEGVSPQEVSNRYVFNALMEDHFLQWAGETNPRALIQTSLSAFLARKPHRSNPDGKLSLRVLLFDQFEELFGLYEECWPQRKEFFAQVRDALDADALLRIVLVMREDTLVKLEQHAFLLPDKLRARFYLEKLRRDAAREAIAGPLGLSCKVLAPGVAEQLADSLATKLLEIRVEDENGQPVQAVGEFVEPVQLQIVCRDMWRRLPDEVTSVTGEYTANLDVEQALEAYYEQAIAAAADKTQIHQNRLRQLCENYLITCTGARNLVHAASLTAQGAPADLLPELETQCLIQPEWLAGSLWYELMHDCLIKPILKSNERWNTQRSEKRQKAYTTLQTAGQRLRRKHVTESEYQFALDSAEKALVISQEIDDAGGMMQALNLTGDIYRERKRYDEALPAYTAALEIALQEGDAQSAVNQLVVIGDACLTQEKHEDAVDAYTKAADITQQMGEAAMTAALLTQVGDVLADLKRDEALGWYTRALDLQRQIGDEQAVAQTARAIAAMHQRNNEFDKAVEFLAEPLALEGLPDAQRAFVLADRAGVYWYAQRYEEAVQDYSDALALDDQMFAAYNGRGQVLAEMGRYRKALKDLKQALSLGREDPVGSAYAHNGRGLAYAGMRQYKQASREFAASIRVCPDNAWLYYNRAQMYELMGHLQQAITDYKTALAKQDPPLTPLKREHAQARLAALGGS